MPSRQLLPGEGPARWKCDLKLLWNACSKLLFGRASTYIVKWLCRGTNGRFGPRADTWRSHGGGLLGTVPWKRALCTNGSTSQWWNLQQSDDEARLLRQLHYYAAILTTPRTRPRRLSFGFSLLSCRVRSCEFAHRAQRYGRAAISRYLGRLTGGLRGQGEIYLPRFDASTPPSPIPSLPSLKVRPPFPPVGGTTPIKTVPFAVPSMWSIAGLSDANCAALKAASDAAAPLLFTARASFFSQAHERAKQSMRES